MTLKLFSIIIYITLETLELPMHLTHTYWTNYFFSLIAYEQLADIVL